VLSCPEAQGQLIICFSSPIFSPFSNKEIATWRSLDLIETLLYLADSGLQGQVTDLLTFPQHHCPDVLVLGLLQINPPITILRQATHHRHLLRPSVIYSGPPGSQFC
jgi:hypothetical protein